MIKNLIPELKNRVNLFLKRRLGWLPARVALGIMSFFGFVNLYMVRVNLSIAIIAMAKRNISGGRDAVCVAGPQDTNNGTSEMQSNPNDLSTSSTQNEYEEGEFSWDETTQGFILGALYYGYMMTQIIGGRLAELYGTKIVFGTAIMGGGALTLFTPLAARWHYGALIALRVLQGIFQGAAVPAMHACLSKWIPPIERPTFIAIVYYATALSTAISFPLCGVIIANHGWEVQFYIMGSLSLLWCIVWFAFMYNTPEEHPRISKEEETYIVDILRKTGTKKCISRKVPWRAIMTSWPAWALFIYGLGNGWGISLYLTQLPTYMRNVLGFSIKSNGAILAAPFLSRYIGCLLWSTVCSYLISRKGLSITNARRIFTVMALGGPGLLLVGLALVGCDATAAVTLLCVALFLNGAASASGVVNHTDIAPNFAGTLIGISNTLESITSCIAPVVTGVITHGQQTLEAWQNVFWVCVPAYLIPAIFTTSFLSGEVQPWNDIDCWNAEMALKTQKNKCEPEESSPRK